MKGRKTKEKHKASKEAKPLVHEGLRLDDQVEG